MPEELQAADQELEELRQFKIGSDKQMAAMYEEIKALKFTNAFQEAVKPFEAAVVAGRLTPALKDKIIAELSAKKATFRDAGDLAISPALAQEIALTAVALPTGSTALSQAGSPIEEPDKEISRLAYKKMAEQRDLNFSDATRLVFAEKPELVKQYREMGRN